MWYVCEGLDRTGKSTIANLYKKQGFEVVHMSAPDKKYKDKNYAGPTYLDDMLEMYLKYDNTDVIFDRSIYGELVWSHVYNREPLLSDDDIQILREFEDRNSAQRILMVDPDQQAHWRRCVENKEPLNIQQFKVASALFTKMAHKYNFIPQQLKDFNLETEDTKPTDTSSKQEEALAKGQDKVVAASDKSAGHKKAKEEENELSKLEKANAIRDVLARKIFKQKGGAFDQLEEDVKLYLKNQLSLILGSSNAQVLSNEEVTILRVFCQRLKEKEGVGKK